MLTPDRRAALAIIAGAALAGITVPQVALAQTTDLARHRALLDAYVDVLLPADNLTPAASSLGVGAAILEFAEGQPLLGRLIAVVADWLDSDGPFARMPPDQQQALVDHMAAADPDLLEGRFYQLIRLFALEFYFAHPAALAGLDLSASPQPQGYPPPWG